MSSIERVPFPRDSRGLIDLECYLRYLPDPPDKVPISLPFNYQGEWVHQHVYFQERVYRQEGVPLENKNMDLVHFRNAPYNQIIMRRRKELKVHQTYEENVSPPPAETIRNCLEDYGKIDAIGAAVVGRQVALNPELIEEITPGTGPSLYSLELSPKERAEFFDDVLHDSLLALHKPHVAPERVVFGAIKRISLLLRDPELQSEAARLLKERNVFYPVRVPKRATLLSLSNCLLRDRVMANDRVEEFAEAA